MNICKAVRITSLALCFVLVAAGTSLAVSFGEFAGGVKTLTESAKDVNEINQDQNETPKAATSKQKKAKKPAKKSSSSRQPSRVQGG